MAMFAETESDPSYYAILNVSKEASADEIKRAYKSLAQVFHPDKHLDDDLRDKAQEAFSKLQEAYEVLSDPQKRDVYDVYGKEGLSAGLSVGTKLKSTDELRKEWEAFKAQQQRAREEAMANHRGIYVCRCAPTMRAVLQHEVLLLLHGPAASCAAHVYAYSSRHCASPTPTCGPA
jgi:DnaJ family protein C protein 11